MTEKKSKTGGYKRPRIGELKKKIKGLTDDLMKAHETVQMHEQRITESKNECHRLHDILKAAEFIKEYQDVFDRRE